MLENGYAESGFSVQKSGRDIDVRIAKDGICHWIVGIQLLVYGKNDAIILRDAVTSEKIRLCVKNGGCTLSLADAELRVTQNDLEALESILLDYLTNRFFDGMHLDLECTEGRTGTCYNVSVGVEDGSRGE